MVPQALRKNLIFTAINISIRDNLRLAAAKTHGGLNTP